MQPEKLVFWIDLNLPPSLAEWIIREFSVQAKSFKELGFDQTTDIEVFKKAIEQKEVVVITTKDIDFFYFSKQVSNIVPKILHINTGNISNKHLKLLLSKRFNEAIRIFSETSQTLVEITEQL